MLFAAIGATDSMLVAAMVLPTEHVEALWSVCGMAASSTGIGNRIAGLAG